MLPSVDALMDDTLALLRAGVGASEAMRAQLAGRHRLQPGDALWPRFVNNHAWALVRLQSKGMIRKVEAGLYEAVVSETPPATTEFDYPPILEGRPLPPWAMEMAATATRKNKVRFSHAPFHAPIFHASYLVALWAACGGKFSMTGLGFNGKSYGSGKARRPFAPSLDRIDAGKPYTLHNCRLVLQAVNFGLNAFGDEVYLQIARATVVFAR